MTYESKTLIAILKDTEQTEHARLLAQNRLLTQCSCILLHYEILSRAACSVGMEIHYEQNNKEELQMRQLLGKAANLFEKRHEDHLNKQTQE